MGALVAAYVFVWLAVQIHVIWLGVKQRRLDSRLDALLSQIEQRTMSGDTVSHAA